MGRDSPRRAERKPTVFLSGARALLSAARCTVSHAALAAAVDFLLPRCCVLCERLMERGEARMVCGVCWTRLPVLPAPVCSRCGHPRTGGDSCRWCELLPPHVRAARSVAWAAGDVGLGVVHALKYQGWHAIAVEMAARMARVDWPQDVLDERSALVPVPLSAKRQRARGYNQSDLLAREVGRRWRLPVWDNLLSRARHTQTQTRLTPDERLRNVAGAFRADATRHPLRGTHLVLVDDVITTAATMNACAAALCAAGARLTSFLTFGRALATGDHL